MLDILQERTWITRFAVLELLLFSGLVAPYRFPLPECWIRACEHLVVSNETKARGRTERNFRGNRRNH
jgi:hypothetical protein